MMGDLWEAKKSHLEIMEGYKVKASKGVYVFYIQYTFTIFE